MALVALASLAALGCGGEQAFQARDGGAGASGSGGRGGGTAGSAGRGGSAGSVGGDSGGAGGSAGGVGGDGSGMAGTGAAGTGTAGTGGAGTGGTSGASGGAGGRGGSGAAGTGGGGTSGGGRGGTGGGGGKGNSSQCTSGGECASTFCVDGYCCASQCTGTCMRCDLATKGLCLPVPDGMDLDSECTGDLPSTCGYTGDCNGAGACKKWGASTVCSSVPACDGSNSSIVQQKVCSGTGSCVAGSAQSCNGFLCSAGPPVSCLASCADDTVCVSGGFCSAAACVATPNLAGNGNLEYGTTAGWGAVNGGTLALATTASGTPPHSGQDAIGVSGRNYFYQGPSYNLPTGPGRYTITVWGMQKDPAFPTINGVLQLRVTCLDSSNPYYVNVTDSGFGVSMPQGAWTMFGGTVDTTAAGADCSPTAVPAGMVRSAVLYLNHANDYCGNGGSGTACLNALYMDDLVVQVTDGHNLVGNPNFEANATATDGWGVSAGSAVHAVSTTFAHGGVRSLRESVRSTPGTGPKWTLPTGPARYKITYWVMHTGTVAHDLNLQTTYTCAGQSAVTLPPIAPPQSVASGTWTQLTGTAVLPPANAMPGCKMTTAGVYVTQEGTACGTGASQVECPDLYVDDVSVTIATTP